jgi:elongation factor 1-beta
LQGDASDSDSSSESDSDSGSDFDLSDDGKKGKKGGKKGKKGSSSSDSDSDSDSSSEEETAEAKAEREAFEARKKAYDEKTERNKLKEQSNVVLDVKPLDESTNLEDVAARIKSTVVCDGLHWGAHELKPLVYGLFKLRIICTIVNVKVGLDFLQEEIEKFEDVQSTDIVSFMKI